MKRLVIVCALLISSLAGACETCRPAVRSVVYDANFVPTLSLLLLPLAIILVIGVLIYRSDA